MSRTLRMVLFGCFGAMVGAMFAFGVLKMDPFGGSVHPYRTHAVLAAIAHRTSNVVASVNFDLRGLDTLGEESILLASVMAVSVLLRPGDDEQAREHIAPGRILDLTGFAGYALFPIAAIIGFDVIAHGHLTPGGGFQGGVVVGSGMQLTYVAGRYQTFRRLAAGRGFEWGEAFGAGAFAALGISALVVSGAFLANVVPWGHVGDLFSAGTVPLLNGLVGIEVASGVVVLLTKFLEQVVLTRRDAGAPK